MVAEILTPQADIEPPWILIGRAELGVKELIGGLNNPRIQVDYHGCTAAGPAPDAVPWCSSLLCFIFEQANIAHPRSKSSQSWRKWGVPCPAIIGAVGVIKWRPWSHKGHVGLVVGVTVTGRILLLGGNQNNEVNIKSYPRGKFVDFRWPSPIVYPDPGSSVTTR